MKKIIVWVSLSLVSFGNGFAQSHEDMVPKLVDKNGRHVLLVDGKPFFILGGQAHNSSAWPAMMPRVWKAVEMMHANTLEIPLYWEQIEPRSGEFNFSLIDTLLIQAREHQVRLVLLWFATWKNGSNHYMPDWMKVEAVKYPNIFSIDGKPADSPSPHSEATLEADKKAFAQVMRYLKKSDPQHTVIMVQVENEPGSWNSVRDYSPQASQLFESPVPAELLKPAVINSLESVSASGGSWQKVFGERADEYFHAWYIARYIDRVAEAGKAEYSLPLYVNAALRDPLSNPKANHYESGGPTDNVIPIWKVAAPHIDLLAPDIYLSGSERILKVLELYHRPDNALFVPEAGLINENAKWLYMVLAMGGIGFSPFGIDDNGQSLSAEEWTEKLGAYAEEYGMAGPMMRELAQWGYEGKITAAVEMENHAAQNIHLGDWEAVISFGKADRNRIDTNALPVGKILIVKSDPNTFLVTGTQCHISFRPVGEYTGRAWEYLKVEEGFYKNGSFHLIRILNGDETDWGGPRFYEKPVLLRISLTLR